MFDPTFLHELARAGVQAQVAAAPVTEADVAGLPPAVGRYFRFMGAVGKSRVWSFRAALAGRFRLGLQGAWRPCRAWQFNARQPLARIFKLDLPFLGPLPVVARDTYRDGHGRLEARLFDWLEVAAADGPDLDAGELVTYLDDALLFAPSLLLDADVRWQARDDGFDVTLADHGTAVTAHVALDGRGAPTAISTDDRTLVDSSDPRAVPRHVRWTTPVAGWTTVEGRQVLARGQAVWELPEGPFPYADLALVPGSLAFNVAP